MANRFDYFERPNGIRLRIGNWHSNIEKAKGSVLFLNGRTEFMEKHLEAIERLNISGLDVFSLDWRGQGLSTRLLGNRRKGYVTNYDDYIGDLAAIANKAWAPSASQPRILMGHSMGGHIGLRFLKEHPGIFEKAVLLSPMIDIDTFPFPDCVLRRFTRAMVNAGFGRAYASGHDGLVESKFDGNRLTSDPKRFESALRLVETNPELALGGVTFDWLDASFKSIKILRRPGYVETIETSILLFSASEDRVVRNAAQREICRRIPNCRFIEIPGARHEILQEKDAIQQLFWAPFENFVFSDSPKNR